MREIKYCLLLSLFNFCDIRGGRKPSLSADVPKNTLVKTYNSSSGGSNHHWGIRGTNTSLFAEGGPNHAFVHRE